MNREATVRKQADDRVNRVLADMHREINELRIALQEMVEAHSMKNVGFEASKRRLEAIKLARAVLDQS